ncbi:MAG: VWA domain-containing protein [Prevotella sp.]|nr:VWA domain-containing protein [Prevotella sp.]
MFRFEDPIYLYLLAVIPFLALLRFIMQRMQRRRLRRFGDPALVRQLMPDVSKWRPAVKFWLLCGALALVIVMIARPQFGTKISHEKRQGIETIIAMDVSNSMLAEDVSPSRLDRCKMMVENLVDHFTDDKIGLIVFAGDAFIQLPITSDYVSAKMFLADITPGMIATQGTDIALAINKASNSFTQDKGIGKAIIVITDGEDHEGGAVEAAKEAKKKGMRVYVLGVGSTNGAPIPVGGGAYMKDRTGNTVMTRLNQDMCREIAKAGGGAYIHVDNNSNAQQQLDNELAKLSKKETESTIYSEYDEQFQAVGIIALLLLIIEICLLECKNPMMRNVHIFGRRRRATATIMMIIFMSTAAMAQSDRDYVRQGNRLFRSGKYAEAEVAYRKAMEKNPRNPQATYNLGNSLFAQKKDSAAVVALESAAQLETSRMRKAMAYHNMGVICQSHQMYGEAIEAYKSALRLNPDDDTTRYNLALCKRQQKKQQDKQNQQNKQDQQKDKNGKDNKQEKQQDKKQDKQQDKQQQEKKDKNQMSKDNAEQLLNAAIQQEKNTQQKMKEKMQQPKRRTLDKNW